MPQVRPNAYSVGGAPKATKRSVSETKKKFVAASQNWLCGDCRRQLPAWFEVDHVIALHNGGTNEVGNLVALCRDCHGKKTAMDHLDNQ
jgi:5-methylcytosine-specific restriction endonuclease McrA